MTERLWLQSVGTVLLHHAKAFGFGSLPPRAGCAVASSVVMRPGKSLRLVARAHHHCHQFDGLLWQPASARGAAAPRAGVGRGIGQCWRNRAARALWRWVCATTRRRVVAGGRHHTRGSVGVRTLRPHAALLHKALFCDMAASRSRGSLGGSHGFAPAGYKNGLMQSGLRWQRAHQPLALPGRCAPYAPPPVALSVSVHPGISQALRASFWSVACGQALGVGPRPPLGLACCAASPARSARPPPKGAPSEPRRGHAACGGGYTESEGEKKQQAVCFR